MKPLIHKTFQLLTRFSGAQKIKTVTMDNGIAAHFMNGILLPLGFLLLSDKEAISGSVTASKIRLQAVMIPKTVINPPIRPALINLVTPSSVGK